MTEPLKKGTLDLLSELDALDTREDHVVDDLLARGARMDELLASTRALTPAELGGLKDALAKLETTIRDVEAGIARAEAAPGAAPSFAELTAEIRSHGAEADRLRAVLRERLVALGGATGAEEDHGSLTKHTDERSRTFRLTTPPMKGTDVKSFQRMLNARFAAWGIHARVPENGEFDAHTRQAARRALLGLGVLSEDYAHGITPALRSLIRTPSRRTPAQLERAKGQRGYVDKLRKRYAKGHAPSKHTARPSRRPSSKPSSKPGSKPGAHGAAGQSVAAAIRAHGGRYEDIIVRESQRSNVPVSLICAVLQIETGFRNVFGHDDVRNPIKSPPRPAPDLEVTEDRYRSYLHHRRLGQGNQGVGPMQLTSPGLQDRADKLGGTWRPGPNIRVGVELLASNIKRLGLRQGVRAYNGTGDRAEKYATKVLELERVWRSRLQGHAANGHAVPSGHASGSASRTFKLTSPQMAGDDVSAFQKALNARFEWWGIHVHIDEDGDYGPRTRHAAHQVAMGLGLATAEYEHGITPEVRSLIRTPSRRTHDQLERAKGQRGYLAKLRKRHARGRRAGAAAAGSPSASYPLSRRASLIGTPHAGTHTLGNWQSDNAVDLGVPNGTKMIALDDGVVVKVRHHPMNVGRFAGDQITIRGDHGNSYFYAHGASSVQAGQRVRRGQSIGTTGSANGVPHLHFGVQHGDPRQIIGQRR
jgi:murein DD-endopeptidase MepM/ murein hydrolase activator NlpD